MLISLFTVWRMVMVFVEVEVVLQPSDIRALLFGALLVISCMAIACELPPCFTG